MARVLEIAYTVYRSDGRVKRHAEALARRGDTVDVICLEPEDPRETNGVNVMGLPMPRYRGASRSGYVGSYARFFVLATAKALALARRHRYDLVIVCTMPDAVVLCAVPLKLLGSKVLLDVHDTMPELYRDKFRGRFGAWGARLLMLEERASAWLADRVMAVHDFHARRLEQAGIPGDKIAVVLNTPDCAIFDRHAARRPSDAGDSFGLVCHGTITHRLGVDLAIEAVNLLRDRMPNLTLKVVGTGDYKHQVRAMVAKLDLGQRVHFEDSVPIDRLPALLTQASVGVVPTRASSAADLMLPVKLLEYASLGIPVIAARLRTIEHYFGDAVAYFEPGNPASLAEIIEKLYRDPVARRAHAQDAARVIDSIAWPIQRERYFKAVDSLLAR